MEALGVVVFIAAMIAIGWVYTKITEAVGNKAADLGDRAFFGRHRRQADAMGDALLRIRTTVPTDELWQQLTFRLPLPSGQPRYEESLYLAGPIPCGDPMHFGMRIDWNKDIQSALVVYRDDNGTTLCEHAMLRWAVAGIVMRKAVDHFQSLRETLFAIVQSCDPTAQATLVTEDGHEFPFNSASTRQH